MGDGTILIRGDGDGSEAKSAIALHVLTQAQRELRAAAQCLDYPGRMGAAKALDDLRLFSRLLWPEDREEVKHD